MPFITSDWSSVYLLAQSDQGSDSAAGSFFSFIFGLAAYIFGSYCFFKLVKRKGFSPRIFLASRSITFKSAPT
ncbi:hypothetical protein NIES4075_27450 [Tolypothrix sp. NIES-4075]|uniref:hypothetical protein n=1 Tax=Tolypothrix sp. NIES-4075 TaxID=2005459 RepID=UPI000B6A91D6|nr:hypothetical protein [Tolypothrix sp. NIES-4075]GAX41748.1 hypothetical protein NIES4075_27450 [Tolypothrix sp. NIES-4075]